MATEIVVGYLAVPTAATASSAGIGVRLAAPSGQIPARTNGRQRMVAILATTRLSSV